MQNQLKSLQDVFSRTAFVIPDYQRGYAWTDEHRMDLLSDLGDLDALGSSGKKHYTGTLVLHRGRHPARRVVGLDLDTLDVVDGQQRLTTLIILLSTVARRLDLLPAEESRELAKRLRDTFVALKDVQKLTPNGDASAFFRDHAIGDLPQPLPATPPERSMLAARRQFDAFVDARLAAKPSDEARLAWLDRWASLVTSGLGFIVFEVEEEADVGVMFEAMNARGKALTQFELVKNYLLFASAKVATGETLKAVTRDVNDAWKVIVKALDDANLSDQDDRLLQYHWWIWQKAKGLDGESLAKTSNVHRAMKQVIRVSDGEVVVVERIREYIADLKLASRAFADLSAPLHARAFHFGGARSQELVERALGLARLGRNAVVMPLLMASVITFNADVPALAEILRLAETFAFRLSLVGSRSNTGESKLMVLASHARKAPLTASVVQDRIRGLIGEYASDRAVEHVLREADGSTQAGNFYIWPHLPHLLFEYERSLVDKAKQKFAHDWTAFYAKWRESIEHILPQGENTLKDKYWADHFTEESWKRCHHRLGNLTLTEWNASYGNKGFDLKCGDATVPREAKVYRNSRFHCERELVDNSEWNEQAIDDRQKKIARFVMERWKA